MNKTRLNIKNIAPLGEAKDSDTPLVGMAMTDITPPPGLPKSGYSVTTKSGEGIRWKLKTRAIYLQDVHGEHLVIVQSDMMSGSLVLHHRLAELLAEKTHIQASRIILTATHTHSGPGSYYESNFYNKHAANDTGFDPKLFDFIVEKMAQTILRAVESARPGKIATGKKDFWGISRNRSVKAWLRNYENQASSSESQLVKKAVDPSLYMMRFDVKNDEGEYQPLGMFSTYSVHNTTITCPVEIYSSDMFGYVARKMEFYIEKQYEIPWQGVCAVSTSCQGDQTPNLPWQGDKKMSSHAVDWQAAKRISKLFFVQTRDLYEELGGQLTDQLELQVAAREINVREQSNTLNVEIARDAAIGNATPAGAQERRTPFLSALPFIKSGGMLTRRWFLKNGPHGTKRIVGTAAMQPILEPKKDFPSTILFMVAKINDMVLLPLPLEVTVTAGKRMSENVAAAFKGSKNPPNYYVVTSVSNGYFGYSTTPEEYDRQEYEGSSTLYGRNTTPYICAQLNKLTRDLVDAGQHIADLPAEWNFDLKVSNHFPVGQAYGVSRNMTQGPTFVKGKGLEEDRFAIEWVDVHPAQIDFDRVLVEVEVSIDGNTWEPLEIDGVPISDDGFDVSIRHFGKAAIGQMHQYEANWHDPILEAGCLYRFAIRPRAGLDAIVSNTFGLAESKLSQAV